MVRLLTLLLLALPLCGATYYVAIEGDDANDGSQGAPWRTTAKAATSVSPGDTVLFGAGTWTGTTILTVSGEEGSRITWDGQGHATLHRLNINGAAYNTVQNFTIQGWLSRNGDTAYGVDVRVGTHYLMFLNNQVICSTNYQGGIRLAAGSQRPFDPNAPNFGTYASNRIANISGEFPAFTLHGQGNIVAWNEITNGIASNPFYLFGQTNTLRGNLVHGLSPDPATMGWGAVSGHPDLIQTFGVSGHGSRGHLIERNRFLGDWTPELQASNPTLAGKAVAGGQLTIGGGLASATYSSHWPTDYPAEGYFTLPITRFGAPWEWIPGANDEYIEIGFLDSEDQWVGETFKQTNSVVIYNTHGNRARVHGTAGQPVTALLGNCAHWDEAEEFYGGWTFRNNIFAGTKAPISTGLPATTWEHNVFYLMGRGVTGHPLTMGVTPWRNNANGYTVRNNAFVDCGSTSSAWYNTGSATNWTADFNFVAIDNGPVLQQDPPTAFRWYEPNGINGGDPMFVSVAQRNFHLRSGSPLIDAGTGSVGQDINGWTRPFGDGIDIGAHEHDPTLQVWLDFNQGVATSSYIEDVSGKERHAFYPMELMLREGMDDWTSPLAKFGPPDFNGFPTPPAVNRPLAVPSRDGSIAGKWHRVGMMTNDASGPYHLSQYAAITNIADGLDYITNGTLAVWVRWGTIAQGATRTSTIIDTGHTTPSGSGFEGSWSLRVGPQTTTLPAIGATFSRYSSNFSHPTNLVQYTHSRDDSTWYHLAMVWNATEQTVVGYQDGVAIVTNDFPFPFLRTAVRTAPQWMADEMIPWVSIGAATHAGSLTWGDDRFPNNGFFVGTMDDLMIWDRALTPNEVGIVFGSAAVVSATDDPEIPPPTTPSFRAGTLNVGTLRGP